TLFAALARSNLPDLALSVVGLAAGMWWLGLLHSSRPADRPSPLPLAIPIAFAADLGLRAAFHSVPVVDVTPTVAAPLALVAALVWSVPAPVVSLVGGLVLGAGVLLAAAALPAAPVVPARSPLAVTLAFAVGWIVFVGTAFGFYAFWAYTPAVYAAVALVVV